MSSETWKTIQEHKKKQESLRERFQKRRRERQAVCESTSDLLDSSSLVTIGKAESNSNLQTIKSTVTSIDPKIETFLQQYLCSVPLEFPLLSKAILDGMLEHLNKQLPDIKELSIDETEFVLQKQAAQEFIAITDLSENDKVKFKCSIQVNSIEISKLVAVAGKFKVSAAASLKSEVNKQSSDKHTKTKLKNEKTSKHSSDKSQDKHDSKKRKLAKSKDKIDDFDDIQALLSTKTAKEQDTTRVADEIQELLSIASTKELSLSEKFRSLGGSQVKQFCPYATREECLKHKGYSSCQKLHFKKILKLHTDESLGDCSFLNTCFHMDTCKYVHYEIDYRGTDLDPRKNKKGIKKKDVVNDEKSLMPKFASDEDYIKRKMLPPQWVNCDIRYLNFSVLGKFSVIMADPPWDIHMELPYGTMQDDEMRALRVQDLSDDGLMFLWVTGRAMELGRELFDIWGYKRCDELIWVKTNQLQRLIRTGRTGHWLNHGKEHCLIGIKGDPKGVNRRLDCDVLVAEVRATSHKPDEIYGIIERLSPGTRKLELFGRMHNIQPNWVTLGNQLDGVHLAEYDVVKKFRKKYPDGKVTKPKPVESVTSELQDF